jgi:hypothetical protein
MTINVANANAAIKAFMIRLHIRRDGRRHLPPQVLQIFKQAYMFDRRRVQGERRPRAGAAVPCRWRMAQLAAV